MSSARVLFCISILGTVGTLLPVQLSIDGVPDVYKQQEKCKLDNDSVVTTCLYNFTDAAKLNLTCVFSGGISDNNYKIEFGKGGPKSRTKSETFTINQENKNITCTAKNTDDPYRAQYTYSIQFKYIPPQSTSSRNPLPATDRSEESSTKSPSTKPNSFNITISPWLWVAIVCTGIFILIFVICCAVFFCRPKKAPPAESNYANLVTDRDNYQSMPKPAPRSLKPGVSPVQTPNACQNPNVIVCPKPDVGQRPHISQKPKAALENVYRDPKDCQDMSEALYAEPNRFIGESDNYAQPYAKSDNYAQPYAKSDNYAQPYAKSDNYAQPYAKSDNYAEPYVACSEGSYAEIQVTPELYATPIPKAQRPPKTKEDEYSNVFSGRYGNTKK